MKRLLAAAVVASALCIAPIAATEATTTASTVVSDDKAASHVRVIAHGGFHRFGISKDSINSQVQAWKRDLCPETDIRLTLDHKIVNMHDGTTFRATGVPGHVNEMTFAEIHALTLTDGQHPPSLNRSMKAAANHGHKCLLVEVKDTDWTPEDYAYMQERAQHFGLENTFRFYISRTTFLEMAHENAPKIKAVWKLLRDTTPREVRGLSLNAIVPRGGRLFRPFIDSIHQIGVKVYAGVNASDELDEWQRLDRLNINGMINNVPVATKRWFDNH